MKRLPFQLILLFNFLVLFSQDYSPKSSGEIITHNYYSLSYNEYHEQANWVHYKLRNALILGTAVRKDNFRADYNVSTKSASPYDYKGTGYDRGHLAPAGDMKINSVAMSESFFMSNISPQNPSFKSVKFEWIVYKIIIYGIVRELIWFSLVCWSLWPVSGHSAKLTSLI